MRSAGIAALVALLLAGCSNPKSTTIPSDPAQWDKIAQEAKKLGDDDRRLLGAYLVRSGMGSALGGSKVAVPPGTTIGDAIANQKAFEADQKIEEARSAALKAKSDAERAAQAARLSSAATVVMTDLTVSPKNYDIGRYNDRLSFVYAVDNHTGKTISGIKGDVVFKDQFGSLIQRMSLSMDEDVAPKSMRTISGYGKDINQFETDDTKLAVTPLAKMKVIFEPQMIVFADGSRIGSEAAPGAD